MVVTASLCKISAISQTIGGTAGGRNDAASCAAAVAAAAAADEARALRELANEDIPDAIQL